MSLCLGATTEADLALQLEAAQSVSSALNSARGALQTYVNGAASLSGIVDGLTKGSVSTPSGYSYKGNGDYEVNGADGTIAKVAFYLPTDTSYGKVGDKINFDLFDASNYFTGLKVTSSVSVSLSGISTNLEFGFSSSGPGAQLLGVAASQSGPVTVDLSKMTAALTKVTSNATTFLNSRSADTIASLEMTSATVPSSTVSSASIALAVSAFQGNRLDNGQTLKLKAANLVLTNAGRRYTGDFTFSSVSAGFSFDTRLHFDASAQAAMVFGCPGDPLNLP